MGRIVAIGVAVVILAFGVFAIRFYGSLHAFDTTRVTESVRAWNSIVVGGEGHAR